MFKTLDDLTRLVGNGIRLALDDLAERGRGRRSHPFAAFEHGLHRKNEIRLLMVILVNLSMLHRLGIPGHDAAPELAHRSERLRQRPDAHVGILLLALLERCDQLIHLGLRFLILDREQHARLDIHQVRRHRDKITGDVEIELAAFLEIGKILL